ncbi:FmdB family zinc ribbon protein [Uliginosibacterium sp. H3]|uniref:FmdB family zinc ribbon protein n=1 Tax=Uliginosibacterium silvisoli TaxID=3114758 RepID=A0ABU6K766_9RHOO|nr:FmdB family zinc ribbon protein [Uliginosibacterium sp. H3]
MPIYEYRCGDCGQKKDYLQKVSDSPIETCPACGSKAFGKALTAAGFQLKGNGWYATDFKGGSASPAATNSGTEATAKTEAPATADAAPSTAASACNPGCACH